MRIDQQQQHTLEYMAMGKYYYSSCGYRDLVIFSAKHSLFVGSTDRIFILIQMGLKNSSEKNGI